MRAQVCASPSHNGNSRMEVRAAPENSKLVAPGCIERHGNTDKGVNVGEKRTTERNQFLQSELYFPNLLLSSQINASGTGKMCGNEK